MHPCMSCMQLLLHSICCCSMLPSVFQHAQGEDVDSKVTAGCPFPHSICHSLWSTGEPHISKYMWYNVLVLCIATSSAGSTGKSSCCKLMLARLWCASINCLHAVPSTLGQCRRAGCVGECRIAYPGHRCNNRLCLQKWIQRRHTGLLQVSPNTCPTTLFKACQADSCCCSCCCMWTGTCLTSTATAAGFLASNRIFENQQRCVVHA